MSSNHHRPFRHRSWGTVLDKDFSLPPPHPSQPPLETAEHRRAEGTGPPHPARPAAAAARFPLRLGAPSGPGPAPRPLGHGPWALASRSEVSQVPGFPVRGCSGPRLPRPRLFRSQASPSKVSQVRGFPVRGCPRPRFPGPRFPRSQVSPSKVSPSEVSQVQGFPVRGCPGPRLSRSEVSPSEVVPVQGFQARGKRARDPPGLPRSNLGGPF